MYGLKESDLNYIVNVLRQHPEIEQAILFGSRAKATEKPGSDIDLALKGKALANIITTISGILNDESPLPYEFDIIDYNSLENQKLKEHIDRVGKIIYTSKLKTDINGVQQ